MYQPSQIELERLLHLQEAFAQLHSRFQTSPGDVRDVALRNCAESASVLVFLYCVISRAVMKRTELSSLFAGLHIARNDELRFTWSAVSACERGFIAFVHFQFEHMVSLLATKLTGKARRCETLTGAAEALIATFHPSVSPQRVRRLSAPFRVAAAIRNCLHNNGVHARPTFKAQVGKGKYTFIKGRFVLDGLPSYVTVLTEALKEASFWLDTSELKRIRVKDPFVNQIGSKLFEMKQKLSADAVEIVDLFAKLSERITPRSTKPPLN